MRTIVAYLSALMALVAIWLLLLGVAPPPERLILGSWLQTGWAYEKQDLPTNGAPTDLLDEVKRSVSSGLIIHEAETWEFLPGQRLRLFKENEVEEVHWRMKGRGHILQVLHADGRREHFQLDKLDENTLQLCFETNIQARGIARLVFSRDIPASS